MSVTRSAMVWACMLAIATQLQVACAAPTAGNLEQAFTTLQQADFVDLTHSFGPTTPHWKGFAPETVTTTYTIPKDGFHVQEFCHPGQWGTHVDPPAHFHDGLKTVDQIDPKQFVLRLVVLDIHEKVAKNADYVVSMEDVIEHLLGREIFDKDDVAVDMRELARAKLQKQDRGRRL